MKAAKIAAILILLLILGGSYYLRNLNYAKIPFPGESMDEYSFTWVGLSLIELGVPIGNSGIPGYKNYDYRYINVDNVFKSTAKGNSFPINTPWFDHPPLLGLLTGGYTYYKGGRVFEDALISFVRKPMIVLGVISVGLLFIYLKKIYGFKEALMGSLIYATSPLAIIGSRVAQAENLLIPLFLLSLIISYYYLEKQKTWMLWLSALIAGTSLLVKLSGISIILSNLFLLLVFHPQGIKKALRPTITYAVVSVSFLAFFISYGYAYDFEQFLAILSANGSRHYGIGPSAFYDLLAVTKITMIKYLTDGWVLSGWLAVFSLFALSDLKRKKELFILVPLICYMIIFFLFGSESYGWYRYPFLPFLFAASARILVLAFRNFSLIIPAFLILLLPIGVNIFKILGIDNFQQYSGIWRWSLTGLLVLFLIFYTKPSSRIVKFLIPVIIVCLFIFAIYLDVNSFLKITPESWSSST